MNTDNSLYISIFSSWTQITAYVLVFFHHVTFHWSLFHRHLFTMGEAAMLCPQKVNKRMFLMLQSLIFHQQGQEGGVSLPTVPSTQTQCSQPTTITFTPTIRLKVITGIVCSVLTSLICTGYNGGSLFASQFFKWTSWREFSYTHIYFFVAAYFTLNLSFFTVNGKYSLLLVHALCSRVIKEN